MKVTQIVLAAVFLFSASLAFAHHNKACHAYWATCEKDDSVTKATDKKAKMTAMDTCVKAAATADTTANGKACLAAKEKHMEHMEHEHSGDATKQ